jgi:hypothetical protein
MEKSKRLGSRKTVLLSVTAIIVVCLVISAVIIAKLPLGSKTLDLSAALSEMAGVVVVRNSDQAPYNPVKNGFLLKSTMQLQTKEQSRVRLDLSTGSIVRLGQLTIFSLATEQTGAQGGLSQIEVQAGRIWVILKGGSLNVNTPAGLASVRGSYMSVWVEPNTNRITVCCLEGQCGYQNTAGDVDMTSGQKIVSSNMNIVPPVEKMDQTDVQSWLDNSPEAVAIVPQITGLVASSTPTATTTFTVSPTTTVSPAASASPTLLATLPPTATVTPSLAPLFTKTATYAPLFTLTNTPQPTRTRTPRPTRTNTPRSTNTYPPPPTDTNTPMPSDTSSVETIQ